MRKFIPVHTKAFRTAVSMSCLKTFMLFFIFFCPIALFAQTDPQAVPFMPAKWNQSVNLIESKLTSTVWTKERTDNTQAVLNDLQKNAKECINYAQAELDKISLAMAQPATANPNETQRLLAASLRDKEIQLNDLRAECRLFLLHSQDVLLAVNKLEEHIIATQVFSKSPSMIENIQNLPSLKELRYSVDASIWRQKLGLPYASSSLMMMPLLVLAGLFFGWLLASYSSQKLARIEKSSFFYTVLAVVSEYSYFLVLTLIFSAFFILLNWPNSSMLPNQISNYVLAYALALFSLRVIFSPPLQAKALIVFPKPVAEALTRRFFYLATLVLAYYICSAVVQGQGFPAEAFALAVALYLSLLIFIITSIVWVVMCFPKLAAMNTYVRIGLSVCFTSVLAVVLVSEWLGFHYFSIFLIRNIAISFILICLALSLQLITFKQVRHLKSNAYLRHSLGVRFNRSIPELDILQAVLLITIWGGWLAILLNVWALSESYYSELVQAIMDGFTVVGFILVPSRIFLAMLLFVFLALGNRLVQVYVSRRSPYYIEEGTQVATASIIGYAGFAISLIISLVIAGVNFTGLAIIAGALSVGIGFGLQNIANNFISGLILLLDNPIRPGDRIQVGDIEGIVKRIRLRATHIYTLRHADVFIPNSELISKSVTNFVFHDKTWSIVCPVGVEYGCDINLVKNLLIQVALKHPEVVQDEDKKPHVYFRKFSDSCLSFELWCLIRDVSRKNIIESDLNSAIYEAFRENDIQIPFPQQDVHIKDWPQHSPPEPPHPT